MCQIQIIFETFSIESTFIQIPKWIVPKLFIYQVHEYKSLKIEYLYITIQNENLNLKIG